MQQHHRTRPRPRTRTRMKRLRMWIILGLKEKRRRARRDGNQIIAIIISLRNASAVETLARASLLWPLSFPASRRLPQQTDKTSILGKPINHMKELKERAKMLEESKNVRRSAGVEPAVLGKRSQVAIVGENETNSSPSSHAPTPSQPNDHLPEIEVRFSEKNVLIKIHCQKEKGILTKIISQIENLHLFAITTNAMAFNDTNFDITVMAMMEPEFEVTPQDVVKSLHSIFQ